MFEVSPEPIEPPAHQHIKLPALRIGEKLVERGATVVPTKNSVLLANIDLVVLRG